SSPAGPWCEVVVTGWTDAPIPSEPPGLGRQVDVVGLLAPCHGERREGTRLCVLAGRLLAPDAGGLRLTQPPDDDVHFPPRRVLDDVRAVGADDGSGRLLPAATDEG